MPERPKDPRQNPERRDGEGKDIFEALRETINGAGKFLADDVRFNEASGRVISGQFDARDEAIYKTGSALDDCLKSAEEFFLRFAEEAVKTDTLLEEARSHEVAVVNEFGRLQKLLSEN